MALHEVEVIISPEGEVRMEVRGVAGPDCLEVTREVEDLLGGQVIARERTAEYDMQPEPLAARDRLSRRD